MKRLEVMGDDIFEANRIVNEGNRITGYSETGDILFRFDGISDESKFSLLDGYEFDLSGTTSSEKEDEIKLLKQRLTETEGALMGMMDMMIGGI